MTDDNEKIFNVIENVCDKFQEILFSELSTIELTKREVIAIFASVIGNIILAYCKNKSLHENEFKAFYDLSESILSYLTDYHSKEESKSDSQKQKIH